MFAATNGDKRFGLYEDPDPSTPAFDIPAPIDIVVGTGRFDNAHGTISQVFLALEGEWEAPGVRIERCYSWSECEGWISY